MIGVLTVLIVCITCINVSKAGMLCSERKVNWQEGINSCSARVGSPVTIYEGNPDSIKQQLNESIEVWASGSTFFEKCDKEGLDVCAYSYIDGNPPKFNYEIRYGDCNVNRNYICWRNGTFGVYQAYHYKAIKCEIYPTWEQAQHLNLPPGYYWRTDNFILCSYQYKNYFPLLITSTSLCIVYNKLHGFFYVNCGSTNYAICEFDDNEYQPLGFTDCLRDHQTSTIIPSSSTVTEKVTTSQPTSTIKLPSSDVTTTRESYVSTHKTTEYNHISDLTTPSTYSTISYKTSTPGTSDTNSNVNEIISTPTSPYTQEQQGNNQAEETNLGLIVGLPVALCVVILGVTVMVVYVWRRRQRHSRDNKGGKYMDGNVRSFPKTNHLQTNNNVTVSNETYNNDVYDDSEQDDYASIDRDDEYDTTTNIKHHQIKTSNTYDRVHIDNTVDEYDDNEDDQYDTTTTHQRCTHQNSSDEYNHVNIKRADGMDLYDTTRSKQPINQTTDNIYNKLDSVDGDKDNIYDKTSSQQQHQRLQVNDDTYNTFH